METQMPVSGFQEGAVAEYAGRMSQPDGFFAENFSLQRNVPCADAPEKA
ncbi:MAG: hypothetical protein IKX13_09345 [Bacteroidales bacterium]|nr:hypothetical protein [Bacteroidales bacterium]